MTPASLTPTRPGLPLLHHLDTWSARLAAPLGRLLLGGMFFQAGLAKIGAYAGTRAFMESVGLPGELLPLVIAFEILAGLAVILGWNTRPAALALAGFTAVTALTFHANLADQMQFLLFSKNVAISGGLLVLAAQGAGVFSLDQRGAKR